MEHRNYTSNQCNQKHKIMANGCSNDSISVKDSGSHSKNLSRNTERSWGITVPTIPKPLPRQLAWQVVSSLRHRRTPKDYLHFVSPRRSEHLQCDSTAARRIDDQNHFSEIQLLLLLASPPPPAFHHSPQARPSACRKPTTWHRRKRLALKHIIIREAVQ
jgi:hypothetical protein